LGRSARYRWRAVSCWFFIEEIWKHIINWLINHATLGLRRLPRCERLLL
jgi:hypothetical protein